ncbi:MAG: hypothetical protein U0Z26_04915 [Anaerolineales bacterium]
MKSPAVLPQLLSALLLFLTACASAAPRSVYEEEIGIYFLLLENFCARGYGPSPAYVVGETETDYASSADFAENQLQSLPLAPEVFESFRKNSEEAKTIDPKAIPNTANCKLISPLELNSMRSLGMAWENENMVISFSAVGFNTALDEAIVWQAYDCGAECAGDDLYYLVRHGDSWSVKKTVPGYRE